MVHMGQPIRPMETAFDGLATACLFADIDGRCQHLNLAAQNLLSLSDRRARGQALARLLPHDALPAAVERDWSGQSITLRELAIDRVIDRPPLMIDCTISPFGAEASSALVVLEMTPTEPSFRMAGDAPFEAVSAMAAGLAHEIKNPLGGLRGAAQLLERELPRAELREYTQVIIREADRLGRLVERMTGSRQPLMRGQFNIHRVLEHVRRLVGAEAPIDVEICCDYDPSIPELSGDEEQLVQAYLNIVRNAAQAVVGGGIITLRTRVRRQFTLRAHRHRQVLETTVEDTGPGIEPALSARIFLPMVSSRADGTGLGLTIAREIIDRHGGAIDCDSAAGCTRFNIYLPMAEQ